MNNIHIQYYFTYSMSESESTENDEYAEYQIDIKQVNLSAEDIYPIFLALEHDIRREVSGIEFKQTQKENDYTFSINIDEMDAEKILNFVYSQHQKLVHLFPNTVVEQPQQIGQNDLAYYSRKFKY